VFTAHNLTIITGIVEQHQHQQKTFAEMKNSSVTWSEILKMLYESGNEGCNATLNLIMSSWDIRYFRTKPFLTSRRPFLIIFTTKSYLRSETYAAYKFYALYPQGVFLWGNLCG